MVLSDIEIKFLAKSLDFAPIQRKVNESELRIKEFCRRMGMNLAFSEWTYFRFYQYTTAFALKSVWKPPKDYPNLKVFLSHVESDLFKAIKRPLGYSNPSKEVWVVFRSRADDRNIVLKRADKVFCVSFVIETTMIRKQKSNLAVKIFIRVLGLTPV